MDHDTNGRVGTKRMRFDNVGDGNVASPAEDERRLRLIRDHGAVIRGLDRKFEGGYSVSDRSHELSTVQGIESGHSIKQNYGEAQVAYQYLENSRPIHNQNKNTLIQNHGYGNSPGADGCPNFKRPRENHEIPAYDDSGYPEQRRSFSAESRFNNQFLQSHATQQHRMEGQSSYYGSCNQSEDMRLLQDPQGFKAQPPLPTSPPPPLPAEPPRFRFSEPVASCASAPGSMFPIADSAPSLCSPYAMVSEVKTPVSYNSKGYPNSSVYHSEVCYFSTLFLHAQTRLIKRSLNGMVFVHE